MNEYVFIDPSPAPGLTHDEVRDLVYSLRAALEECLEAVECAQAYLPVLTATESTNKRAAENARFVLAHYPACQPCRTCRGSGWVMDTDRDGTPTCQADCPDCSVPVKHPDTERLDWLDAQSEPIGYEDAPHATAWHIETEPGERIDLRAAIDAARKEARP